MKNRTSIAMILTTILTTAAPLSVAEAKQCIWNKAGFVLEAHWYKPGDVLYDEKGEFYIRTTGRNHKPVAPAQLDVYPVAQGRCWEGREKMTAVLAIKDGHLFNTLMTAGTTIVAGSASTVAGAAVCAASVGTLCAAAIVGGTAATGALSTAMQLSAKTPELKGTIPNAFAITVPAANRTKYANRWLDVWGTVMSPQIGPGGPL